MTAARLRTFTVALLFALIAVVVAWQLAVELSGARIFMAALLTIPLWAPVRGVLRHDRRTYAWATLCVIPYFILGVTEAVANPTTRLWAGACLALALLLFAVLIAYLRVTNPIRSSH